MEKYPSKHKYWFQWTQQMPRRLRPWNTGGNYTNKNYHQEPLVIENKQFSELSRSLLVKFPPPNKKIPPAKFIIPLHWGKRIFPLPLKAIWNTLPTKFSVPQPNFNLQPKNNFQM